MCVIMFARERLLCDVELFNMQMSRLDLINC